MALIEYLPWPDVPALLVENWQARRKEIEALVGREDGAHVGSPYGREEYVVTGPPGGALDDTACAVYRFGLDDCLCWVRLGVFRLADREREVYVLWRPVVNVSYSLEDNFYPAHGRRKRG